MLLYLMQIDGFPGKVKFSEIYLKYRNLMFYVAREITGDDRDAEDAVHEAFIYLCRAIDKIDNQDPGRTKAFLLAVTQSRAIDLCRKRRKQWEVPFEEAAHHETADEMARVDERDALTRAMAGLDAESHRVLILKYDSGLDAEEIAAIIGKSREAVYKILQRARVRLAETLREEGVDVAE